MFQLLAGYHPFAENCRLAVLLRVFKTLGTPSQNILNHPSLLAHTELISLMPQWEPIALSELVTAPPEALELLNSMLQIEPTKRIKIQDCLSHPFFE